MQAMLVRKSSKERLLAPTADSYLPKQHDDGKHQRGRKRCSRGGGGEDREYAPSVVTVVLVVIIAHIADIFVC